MEAFVIYINTKRRRVHSGDIVSFKQNLISDQIGPPFHFALLILHFHCSLLKHSEVDVDNKKHVVSWVYMKLVNALGAMSTCCGGVEYLNYHTSQ